MCALSDTKMIPPKEQNACDAAPAIIRRMTQKKSDGISSSQVKNSTASARFLFRPFDAIRTNTLRAPYPTNKPNSARYDAFPYDESIETRPFFSSFDKGREIFDDELRPTLSLWAKWAAALLAPSLSTRCYHHQGGAKKCLRDLTAFLRPTDFVYKSDVCSYYASMSHARLYDVLYQLDMPKRFIHLVGEYCTRCIVGPNEAHEVAYGIAKGGALSPILAAAFLCPLDKIMERWMKRGDIFYARFQDDVIIVARSKHAFKRAIAVLRNYIDAEANMGLRPEKTFIGRASTGFDFLGYNVRPDGLRPSKACILKATDKAKRCYAHGGDEALAGYLKRWNTWVKAGVKDQMAKDFIQTNLQHR